MSVNDHENTASIKFGVTNKFERVGKFIKLESANNEDWLSLYMYVCAYTYLCIYIYGWSDN